MLNHIAAIADKVPNLTKQIAPVMEPVNGSAYKFVVKLDAVGVITSICPAHDGLFNIKLDPHNQFPRVKYRKLGKSGLYVENPDLGKFANLFSRLKAKLPSAGELLDRAILANTQANWQKIVDHVRVAALADAQARSLKRKIKSVATGPDPKYLDSVFVFFDFSDDHETFYTATNFDKINQAMLASGVGSNLAVDAFGVSGPLFAGKWSPVQSIKRGIQLYTRNQECGYNATYGRNACELFDITATTKQRLEHAFRCLADNMQTAVKLDDVIVLIVPMVAKPLDDDFAAPDICGMFTCEGKAFKDKAEEVKNAILGSASIGVDFEYLVVVAKVTDSVAPLVLCSNRYSREHVARCIELWAGSIPNGAFSVRPMAAKSDGSDVRCVLNASWGITGDQLVNSERFTRLDGFKVFIDQSRSEVDRMLNRIASNTIYTLTNAGRLGRGKRSNPDDPKKMSKIEVAANQVWGLISILLKMKGFEMENSAMYVLGQILNCANALHEAYHSGNKRTPAKLIGEEYIHQLLGASDFPGVLSRFWRRLELYTSWARRNEDKKIRGSEVGRISGRLNNLVGDLRQVALPSRLNNEEKCALGVGYYARAKKSNVASKETEPKETE